MTTKTRAETIAELGRRVRAFLYGSSFPCLNLRRRDIAEAYADGTLKLIVEKRHVEAIESIMTGQERLIRDFQERERVLDEALSNLIDSIPGQTADADWWPDDLSNAFENAKQTLAKLNGDGWME